MTDENYVTFEEFMKTQQPSNDDQPVEEILNDVKETLNTFKGRWTT